MNIDGNAPRGSPGADENTDPPTELHCRAVPADPERLPALRRAVAGWAACVNMSAEQIELVVLASYEALANATAHAYPHGGGVLEVHAVYRPISSRAEVVVTDYGRWQEPPVERRDLGGRGLVLIESLAEHAEVTTTTSGTSVRMSWTVLTDAEVTQRVAG
ncbi:ATP-binding protein [Parasphingorhabdus pacifica]